MSSLSGPAAAGATAAAVPFGESVVDDDEMALGWCSDEELPAFLPFSPPPKLKVASDKIEEDSAEQLQGPAVVSPEERLRDQLDPLLARAQSMANRQSSRFKQQVRALCVVSDEEDEEDEEENGNNYDEMSKEGEDHGGGDGGDGVDDNVDNSEVDGSSPTATPPTPFWHQF